MIDQIETRFLCRPLMRRTGWALLLLALSILSARPSFATESDHVSQYGITWAFDKPYPVGQFVNGDYWVVGPVTIVGVSPASGPASSQEPATSSKSRYGATALIDDKQMRNGSMIFLGPYREDGRGSGFGHQGYDSRAPNYAAPLSVVFPCRLPANQTLISTISSETYADNGSLATPSVLGENGIFLAHKKEPLALETAAVLTCLKEAPPADAFRPPYVGTDKPIYTTRDIHWDLLPRLKPVPSTPDWSEIERIFERPWLDHIDVWLTQYTLPGENGPSYGREFARMSSIASLMLMLDVPREQKQKLLIEYIQLGIDLHGVARMGRNWFSDGGHWQGRKWPILFASLMLDKEELRAFPPVDLQAPVYGQIKITASDDVPAPTTLFQEDLDTYYGKGARGQTVLWQMVFHTHANPPYEELPMGQWNAENKLAEGYRPINSASWIGVALSAQLMKARAIWDHDAFFDYVDRWMSPDEKWKIPSWLPKGCTHSFDPFVEEMWTAYRQEVPAQPGGQYNFKWVADETKKSGHFVLNSRELVP
jgi:hypothetical protein